MLWWAGVAVALLIASAVYFLFFTPPTLRIGIADSAGIAAARPARLLVVRFRPDPDIVVLDFPARGAEGAMLNRVTAFLDKQGVPHDRVLSDAELAAAIRASGATPDDYAAPAFPAAGLVRFFRTMARDRVAPNPEEGKLRALVGQLHWFAPGAVGALAVLPGPIRQALAGAAYFVSPAYAVDAERFFHDVLTPGEQEEFRRFLASRGVDTDSSDVVVNRAQAMVVGGRTIPSGIAPGRWEALRAGYVQGIPLDWLKKIAN